MEGVTSFDVNLETQKVTVVGTVTLDEVMAKIAKTGKAVEPWSD
jgi:copper chaperone